MTKENMLSKINDLGEGTRVIIFRRWRGQVSIFAGILDDGKIIAYPSLTLRICEMFQINDSPFTIRKYAIWCDLCHFKYHNIEGLANFIHHNIEGLVNFIQKNDIFNLKLIDEYTTYQEDDDIYMKDGITTTTYQLISKLSNNS